MFNGWSTEKVKGLPFSLFEMLNPIKNYVEPNDKWLGISSPVGLIGKLFSCTALHVEVSWV